MKITKEGDELVIRIPFSQGINNPYMADEDCGTTDNVIGVIAGDECTISQLNDLSYKGDQQEGPALVHWYGNEDEFRKICSSLGIQVWEHESCVRCSRPIYGSCTWDGGPVCYDCDEDFKEKTNDKKQVEENKL